MHSIFTLKSLSQILKHIVKWSIAAFEICFAYFSVFTYRISNISEWDFSKCIFGILLPRIWSRYKIIQNSWSISKATLLLMDLCNIKEQNFRRKYVRFVVIRNIFSSHLNFLSWFVSAFLLPKSGRDGPHLSGYHLAPRGSHSNRRLLQFHRLKWRWNSGIKTVDIIRLSKWFCEITLSAA